MRKTWTKTDDNTIIGLLKNGYTYDYIGQMLNLSKSSIKNRLSRLGYKYENWQIIIDKVISCITCGKETTNPKYCSSRCSALDNNAKRVKIREFLCLNCNTQFSYRRSGGNKFCNMKCAGEYNRKQSIINWLSGNVVGWTGQARNLKRFIREYLKGSRGSACIKCGWDERHPVDGNSLTEINHIDGDAENCVPENLEILCPNCHSMTYNYKARNKDSKRNR